ncbi:MAG: ATP-dependent DNA helicase RecG [Anaerolineae bacterium]
MLPAFQRLTKMLTQEKRLGYNNKAVIGGLERLAGQWGPEALAEAQTVEQRKLIERIVIDLRSYPGARSTAERQTLIENLLETLQNPSLAPEREAPPSRPATGYQEPPPKTTDGQRQKEARRPAPPSPPPASGQKAAATGLEAPVTRLPGIKSGNAKKLEKLGIRAIGDLLTLYPRRYDDYRSLKTINQLEYGQEVTIIGQIWDTRARQSRQGRTIVTTLLSDGTGTIEATWFNQPWLTKKLTPGTQIVLSGKVDEYLGRLVFQSPEWEELDKNLVHTGRLVPVYPLTAGVTAKWLRSLIKRTVDYWSQRLPDHLPDDARQRLGFPTLAEATKQIHFPDDWDHLEAARRRLAFDELLLIQLGVMRQRRAWEAQKGRPVHIKHDLVERFIAALPFKLTQAQRRTLDEILADLQKEAPMSRLLQGDVGSGKTVVALAAMVAVNSAGGQATILAPTEILAEQHFQSMGNLLATMQGALGGRIVIRLLTGSTPAAERRELLAQLAGGQIDILVGTHAIIQEKVEFQDLRLAIIDEQHRFGVSQRRDLREKGFNPHLLVMSATPIPRTLALTLYGDLDLSIIDEMPPGRQVIKTRWLGPEERERAYQFIRSKIEQGQQAFIICPLVEESDKIEAKSAKEEHRRLQETIFPQLKLGLLHGRLKSDQKEKVMADFRDRKLDILVSTSVVEVGIDVPNAAVMLVEGANRFGLAQLHQFRGRVGRGRQQSYCLLLVDKSTSEAEARLRVMEETTDGLKLAEEDLKLRGPGEFFGTRQSGLPDMKLVKLTDTALLELARREAQTIFDEDPQLARPEHRLLARRLNEFWEQRADLS